MSLHAEIEMLEAELDLLVETFSPSEVGTKVARIEAQLNELYAIEWLGE